MAEARLTEEGEFVVSLERDERDTLTYHCQRENIPTTVGICQMVTQAIRRKSCEICVEECGPEACDDSEYKTLRIHVDYPEFGPCSLLTDEERSFVNRIITNAVGYLVETIIHERKRKGT